MTHFYFGVLVGLVAAWLHDVTTRLLKRKQS